MNQFAITTLNTQIFKPLKQLARNLDAAFDNTKRLMTTKYVNSECIVSAITTENREDLSNIIKETVVTIYKLDAVGNQGETLAVILRTINGNNKDEQGRELGDLKQNTFNETDCVLMILAAEAALAALTSYTVGTNPYSVPQ